MDKKNFRIVFMGTPEFAEYSLKKLVSYGYNVVGVVTMPDKPAGRHGSVLRESPVKRFAVSCGIPVLQPEKLRNDDFLSRLRLLNAHLQIVVAFRMLPEVVWSMPEFGTINLHASLLPQYRGAAPINWALINGEKETGVTTFFLRRDIDTGDIISQKRVTIDTVDNAGTVHDKLMTAGAGLLVGTVNQIIERRFTITSQSKMTSGKEETLKTAPKIFKETCRISWNNNAATIHDFIRGLSPYPAAWTELHCADGQIVEFKIIDSEKVEKVVEQNPGQIRTDSKTFIEVAVNDGYIRLLTVQAAGKKRLSVNSFLCGFRISETDFFE